MNFINLTLLTLLLFISQIKCIDIKLSLLKKEDNANKFIYPVSMTFKDNEIQQNNKNISFLCIFDYLPQGSELEYFKSMMRSIVKNLALNDKITFITNEYTNRDTISSFIGELNNEQYKNITKEHWYINDKAEKACLSDEKDSDFIKIMFFFGKNNKKDYYYNILNKVNECLNNPNSEYPIYFYSTDWESYPKEYFPIFSDSRNIAFIPIRKDGHFDIDYDEYTKSIIEDIRNIKYKSNITISIISKYEINKFYGKDDLNKSNDDEHGNLNYSFIKYQIIPRKEYTYFFEVNLTENIKYGDRILYVNISYTNLNKIPNNAISSSLKFYNAINYFKLKKDELCKTQLIEGLDIYLHKDPEYLYTSKLKEAVYKINDDFCGPNFSDSYLNLSNIEENSKGRDMNDFNRTCNNNFYYLNSVLKKLFYKKFNI